MLPRATEEAEPSVDGVDDGELMDSAAAGDAAALEALYRRHREQVAGLALRLTGHPAAALHVLERSFALLAERLAAEPRLPWRRAWLFRVARALSLDLLARQGRVAARDGDASWLEPDPEWRVPLGRVGHVVAALEAGPREALLLRLAVGLDAGEIAEVLGLPPEESRSRLEAALTALAPARTCAHVGVLELDVQRASDDDAATGHAAECACCRRTLESLSEAAGELSGAPTVLVPRARHERILATLRETASLLRTRRLRRRQRIVAPAAAASLVALTLGSFQGVAALHVGTSVPRRVAAMPPPQASPGLVAAVRAARVGSADAVLAALSASLAAD